MKFIHKNEAWSIEKQESDFLFSYLLRFRSKSGLQFDESQMILAGESLLLFRTFVHEALSDLIQDCYVEPSIKERQKKFLLFEKFNFDNRKIVVNYTTNPLGRLIYTIFLRLTFIDKLISNDSQLQIEEIKLI